MREGSFGSHAELSGFRRLIAAIHAALLATLFLLGNLKKTNLIFAIKVIRAAVSNTMSWHC